MRHKLFNAIARRSAAICREARSTPLETILECRSPATMSWFAVDCLTLGIASIDDARLMLHNVVHDHGVAETELVLYSLSVIPSKHRRSEGLSPILLAALNNCMRQLKSFDHRQLNTVLKCASLFDWLPDALTLGAAAVTAMSVAPSDHVSYEHSLQTLRSFGKLCEKTTGMAQLRSISPERLRSLVFTVMKHKDKIIYAAPVALNTLSKVIEKLNTTDFDDLFTSTLSTFMAYSSSHANADTLAAVVYAIKRVVLHFPADTFDPTIIKLFDRISDDLDQLREISISMVSASLHILPRSASDKQRDLALQLATRLTPLVHKMTPLSLITLAQTWGIGAALTPQLLSSRLFDEVGARLLSISIANAAAYPLDLRIQCVYACSRTFSRHSVIARRATIAIAKHFLKNHYEELDAAAFVFLVCAVANAHGRIESDSADYLFEVSETVIDAMLQRSMGIKLENARQFLSLLRSFKRLGLTYDDVRPYVFRYFSLTFSGGPSSEGLKRFAGEHKRLSPESSIQLLITLRELGCSDAHILRELEQSVYRGTGGRAERRLVERIQK
jgi:hypothetical protein